MDVPQAEDPESSRPAAYPRWRAIGLAAGPCAAALLLLLPTPRGLPFAGQAVAAVLLWMALWWVTEAVPIPVTSLLPVVLFPLLGVMPTSKVTLQYANHFVFLFLGGFLLAAAIRRWGLGRRIAVGTVLCVGTGQRRLVLGFMLATAVVSMWVSNTATTLLMYPIAIGVIGRLEEGGGFQASRNFAPVLLLGIAYAAAIGGMGSLIGTPPNGILAGLSSALYPDAPPITMTRWFAVGIPSVLFFLPIAWFYLVRIALPIPSARAEGAAELVREEWRRLGPMGRGEKMTLALFLATGLLWIFRAPMEFGAFRLPGWAELFGGDPVVSDALVAIGAVIVACFLPVSRENGRREFLLDWRAAEEVPWGILILFGGGFAIASGFETTGLAQWLGGSLSALGGMPPLVAIAIVCLALTFLTEVTSNTAITATALPILAPAAVAAGLHPWLLMIPAAVSASCAFMLPIGTPPNAIIFGSGRISIALMARVGFWLNLIGVVVLSLVVRFIALPLLGVPSPPVAPPWAH